MEKVIELTNIEICEYCMLNLSTGEKEFYKNSKKLKDLQVYFLEMKNISLQ